LIERKVGLPSSPDSSMYLDLLFSFCTMTPKLLFVSDFWSKGRSGFSFIYTGCSSACFCYFRKEPYSLFLFSGALLRSISLCEKIDDFMPGSAKLCFCNALLKLRFLSELADGREFNPTLVFIFASLWRSIMPSSFGLTFFSTYSLSKG
jgi:hypothetical protein